jgi:hypothetical protein
MKPWLLTRFLCVYGKKKADRGSTDYSNTLYVYGAERIVLLLEVALAYSVGKQEWMMS